MPANYITQIEHRVAGIPCIVAVTNFHRQRAMGPTADSDLDCYGYTEVEYELLDRKGYRAAWLEKKVTSNIEDDIKQAIINDMESSNEE